MVWMADELPGWEGRLELWMVQGVSLAIDDDGDQRADGWIELPGLGEWRREWILFLRGHPAGHGSGRMSSCDHDGMADAPYLVALALFDQGADVPCRWRESPRPFWQQKAMPRTNSARNWPLTSCCGYGSGAMTAYLSRAAAAESLLLVELPMERLPEDLPRIKADWLNRVTQPPVSKH